MTSELRVVLLDGMGTLVRLVPPGPALAEALGVDLATAERAFEAEVAYYVAHHLEGSDPSSLGDLRRRCAEIVADETGTDPERAFDALMRALRFEAWEDAPAALEAIRAAGLRAVVVSNWDCSLPDVLERAGVAVDNVVTSAEVGAAKPDARIFDAALRLAGCTPAQAIHVGDSLENDVAGATAAGIRALLLDRNPGAAPDRAPGAPARIAALTEVAALLS